jgi:hypothetical protein
MGEVSLGRPGRRQEMLAFVAALAFACVATVGLVEQRLAPASRVSVWICAASLVCALQLVLSARVAGHTWTKIHAAQLVGAATGVVAVHTLVAVKLVPHDPALVESPAQLVNDAVLVGGVLALVWAVVAPALRSRLIWFAIALVPSFAYFRTPLYWHCDRFAGFPVQHYVAAQLTVAFDVAVALAAYLATGRRTA